MSYELEEEDTDLCKCGHDVEDHSVTWIGYGYRQRDTKCGKCPCNQWEISE